MSVIDDYLGQFGPSERYELQRIRSIAHKVLPSCEETISYGMPTIKYKGKSIVGFDVHKDHIGIYPFSGQVISKIDELKGYSTTPGAIQEKPDNLLSDELIEKVIRERVKQAGV